MLWGLCVVPPPLLAAWYWKGMQEELRKAGFESYAFTLPITTTSSLIYELSGSLYQFILVGTTPIVYPSYTYNVALSWFILVGTTPIVNPSLCDPHIDFSVSRHLLLFTQFHVTPHFLPHTQSANIIPTLTRFPISPTISSYVLELRLVYQPAMQDK
jgi:hypothetical protein